MVPRFICLFDIDGTLIASGGAGKAALEAAVAEVLGVEHALEKMSLSGRTDRGIVRDLLHQLGRDETPAVRAALTAAYLRHLPEFLHRTEGRILPGVAALLDLLQERHGVALGLLTGNVRAGATVKLGHYGLAGYFDFGGFGDEHFDRDDVAREALAAIHARWDATIDPARVWVIGDTPLDVRCARVIGARVVAVATGWHSAEELAAHQPDLLLTDLADPAAFLGHLAD
jgi:phosphoglycolate phosphatase-like HAD superfamily hydrolase